MSTGYIYRITNTLTGDFYIGMTRHTLSKRFTDHCSAAKNGSQYHFHRALRKYGTDTFIIEAIETVDIESISERERYWIHTLHPSYNMTGGGEGGDYWKGKVFSEEHRRKLGDVNRGKKRPPMSEEQKEKLRQANLGKKASPETKARMSATRKGVPKSPEHKAKLLTKLMESNRRRFNAGDSETQQK